MLSSAIAAFFYIRVIVMMFFTDPTEDSVAVTIPSIYTSATIAITTTNNVYHLTGPGLMDDLFAGVTCTTARVEEVCLQGNFTNKFFQYMDKPGGDWVTAKKTISAVSSE